MVIGTRSTSTILEVFRIGITELSREVGYPKEVIYKTDGCELHVLAEDIIKRVDSLAISFTPKEGANPKEVSAAMEPTKIPHSIEANNGTYKLTLPSFEWRQLPQLAPVDGVVEKFVPETLRSKSWHVEVKQYRVTNINVNVLIEDMLSKGASDLHLRAGSPPYIRLDGELLPIENMPPLSADDLREVIYKLGGQAEVDRLESELESSFQYHSAGIGYLRVSGYVKMGAMALAIRFIPEDPIPFDQLQIPEVVRDIADSHRGLFLVCGITGSGKSTTLAAMVDYVNSVRHAHIITTEDPIEFVYKDKKSIISQRQVGRDTFSFANALRGALREDPDVILVGEMRDQETIRAAISAAETGHLVFSTLHTMTAIDTVNRIISYFPQSERELIRQELAYTLKGVVCQRLLKKKGGGRIPCVEILLGGKPIVRDAILEGEIDKLQSIIEVDSDMKSFDQYAVELYKAGTVDKEQAVSACADEEAFERTITGIRSNEGRGLLG
jgi:twitching motility protein PilT